MADNLSEHHSLKFSINQHFADERLPSGCHPGNITLTFITVLEVQSSVPSRPPRDTAIDLKADPWLKIRL